MPDRLIPIRQYADTAANLASSNPVLLNRQLAIETDTGKAKIGNGTTAYNLLPYIFIGNLTGSGTVDKISKFTGTGDSIGDSQISDNGLSGISITTIPAATTDTDKFVVSDNGTLKFRTGSEVLSDIGGQTALTNPITGTGANGQVAYFTGTTSQTGSNNLFWNAVNQRLGINTATPSASLQVIGSGTTSATTALSIQNLAGVSKLVVKDDGAIEVGRDASGTTQATASVSVTGSETNIGLALVTKGTGAITAQIPDGTAAGGNARGDYAVDFQIFRTSASQVASGNYATIAGGLRNTASGPSATVGGGYQNTASSGYSTIAGGLGNNASANYATVAGGAYNAASGSSATIGGGQGNIASGADATVAGGANNIASIGFATIGGGIDNRATATFATVGGGQGNIASGPYATVAGGDGNSADGYYATVSGGSKASASLYGQSSVASGRFGANGNGDAQTSNIRLRRSITGTAQTELFLDGASVRAILALPTGATAGRLWNAKIQVVAIVSSVGNGTVTVGDSFVGNYTLGIKRIGTATSLVGGGLVSAGEAYDINMADAVFTASADDTNEALKLEFTPPSTAGSTTVTRVVATVYLTEVGY